MIDEVSVVAVGGPADGRRYQLARAEIKEGFSMRVFSDGPMRGNRVTGNISLPRAMYCDYDLGGFGSDTDGTMALLKPVGSTLFQVMSNLTNGYAGVFGGQITAIALQRAVTLLRDARFALVAGRVCDEIDLTGADIDAFLTAYDSKEPSQ